MKVLFNADDFGLTKGTTDGIIHAHLNGVVQSTTLMMNGLAVDYAIRRAKQTTTLKVGIHLVLTCGKPVMLLIDKLLLGFYGNGIYEDVFENLRKLDAQSVEVMTHPAFVDNDLRSVSSYVEKRQEELNIFCQLQAPDEVQLTE